MNVPAVLLGDYCDACRREELPLALYRVRGGQEFTFCGPCRVRHGAVHSDNAAGLARLKENVATIIERGPR